MNYYNSAVIQEVSAQTATISYVIDNFIDKTPIEEISNSVEDLDAATIRAKNCRTQFRSKYQELRIALGNEFKERYNASFEKKN